MNKKSLIIIIMFMFGIPYSKALSIEVPNRKKIEKVAKNSTVQAEVPNWKQIEEMSRNSVVQIEAKGAKFNWLEPYKSPEQVDGVGSGFFIDTEGHILTNYHVIEDARYLSIFIPCMGRKSLEAVVVGIYPEIDCALLQLTPESINTVKKAMGSVPYLPLGDSDQLYSTKSVMALGYPFGKRYLKSTIGEVAGKDYVAGSSYTHVTAPLNPGNSGGPLLNSLGQVLGINSAILTGTQSVCYCIDINDIKAVLNNLMTEKVIRKPKLGFNFNALTEEHANLLGNNIEGVFINSVYAGSLADKAALQVGDVLTSINGLKIDNYGDVSINKAPFKMAIQEYMMKLPLNQKIDLQVFRSGKTIDIKADYTYQPSAIEKVYPEFEPELLDYEMFGGMCVMELTQNHINALNMGSCPFNEKVLIITNILSGSPVAATNCINAGMTLNSINGSKVSSLSELRSVLSNTLRGKTLTLVANCNITTAVSVDKILKEEARLSRDFKFPISQVIKKLI